MTELRQFAYDAIDSKTDECILWPFAAAGLRVKYGRMTDEKGVTIGAHRFVCMKVHGKPPTRKHQAAHLCSNSLCLNPRHLRWATRKENEADKIAAGRTNRGSRNGRSKLTEAQVQEIRRLRVEQELTHQALAERFNCSRRMIGFILRGSHWRFNDPSDLDPVSSRKLEEINEIIGERNRLRGQAKRWNKQPTI